MVCRLAGGCGTGVFTVQDGQVAPGELQLAGRNAHTVHHPESVSTQLSGLGRLGASPGSRALEAVRPAAHVAVFGREVSTGNVQHGVGVQITAVVPQVAERDALGVAQQPGCFMIEGSRPLLELAHPQKDSEAPALRAEPGTIGDLPVAGLASLGPGCQIAASK
jgi:hypothetical protein